MIKIVSWNIAKKREAWSVLAEMALNGEADLALVQEAGKEPPRSVSEQPGFQLEHVALKLDRRLGGNLDRWPAVVKLSDRVEVDWLTQVPVSAVGTYDGPESAIEVSDVGTLAVAKVTVAESETVESFIAASMYARWLGRRPESKGRWIYSDASAHRILSDLSSFVAFDDPSRHRLLVAGDLNMFYGATGHDLSIPERERTVWKRSKALGLRFMGPQWPNASRRSVKHPDVPRDTKNVPTYHTVRQSPDTAVSQLDYVFASRGFHRRVRTCAMNSVKEWGPSDHCRLMIEVESS